MRKDSYLLLLCAAALLLIVLIGCERQETEETVIPPQDDEGVVRTASDLMVELTYPQSDDDWHYVRQAEPGEVIVEGVVSGSGRMDVIEVNGVAVAPYEVEYITPYGRPTDYPVYRFRAPVVMQPEDNITVVADDGAVEYTFVPNTDATIERWVAAAEGDPVLRSRLGSAYYASGAYVDATDHLERAIEYDDSPWLLYDLGMSYLALDRANDAVVTFDRVEPMYASMPDLYYGRGLTYSTMNRPDDAIADFTRASELVPDWAEPLVALGLTHYAQERLGDAVGSFDGAIAILPEWAVPYYGLALVRLDQDRDDDAIVLMREAEQRGPWRAEHHRALARKLWQKGNHVAARRQIEIARKLGGEPDGWWREVERETPDYDRYDAWPWEPRADDDGYRISAKHPWYSADRPRREGRARGADRGGPPADRGPGADRGGPPADRGQGADRGGPPADRGQGADRGGPPADRGQGADRGGPPADRGQGADRGGPPADRGQGR